MCEKFHKGEEKQEKNQKQRGANWVNIKIRDGLSLAVRLIIKIP